MIEGEQARVQWEDTDARGRSHHHKCRERSTEQSRVQSASCKVVDRHTAVKRGGARPRQIRGRGHQSTKQTSKVKKERKEDKERQRSVSPFFLCLLVLVAATVWLLGPSRPRTTPEFESPRQTLCTASHSTLRWNWLPSAPHGQSDPTCSTSTMYVHIRTAPAGPCQASSGADERSSASGS